MNLHPTVEEWEALNIEEKIIEVRELIDYYENEERKHIKVARNILIIGYLTPLLTLCLFFNQYSLISFLILAIMVLLCFVLFRYHNYKRKINSMEKRSFQPLLESMLHENYGLPLEILA